MRIISLNAWGGKMLAPLVNFLKTEALRTDIFCFQEVYSSPESREINGEHVNLFTLLCEALPLHTGFFAPAVDGETLSGKVDFDASYGLAIFVKKSLRIHAHGDIMIYGQRNWSIINPDLEQPRNMQYAHIEDDTRDFWLLNFHGLWVPGKEDNHDRIKQSEKIAAFVKSRESVVLCGDFNLEPHTQSVGILEQEMRNMIKEFNVKTTRSKLYTKAGRFADYTFVKNLSVKNFDVPYMEVSDHLPMILEF